MTETNAVSQKPVLDYVDDTEREVVNYCMDNGIYFELVVDLDGNRHYRFTDMIDSRRDNTAPGPPVMGIIECDD